MLIEKYEKIFMQVSAVFLFAAVVALVVSVTGDHASLPEPAGRLDPDDVRTTEPFDEPGVFQTGDNEYSVVMIAQAWQWEPAEIEVPAEADVTFTVTSTDVIHGFWVPETQANAMVDPRPGHRVHHELRRARDPFADLPRVLRYRPPEHGRDDRRRLGQLTSEARRP